MILCGYNDLTRRLGGTIIDVNAEGEGVIKGDPSREDVLLRAGIERESVLIAATESDEKNIYITLLAKKLNPRIKVAVIVSKAENVRKAYQAGADYAVLESEIVGREILRFLLAPRVASFIDRIMISGDLSIVGLNLPDRYCGKRIKDTNIRRKIGIIVGIKRGDKFIKKPGPNEVLRKGDVLIFILQGKEINKIKGIMGQWILPKD